MMLLRWNVNISRGKLTQTRFFVNSLFKLRTMATQFLCKVGDLNDGQMKEVVVSNMKVLVTKEDGTFSALGPKCPHYGAQLVNGHFANGFQLVTILSEFGGFVHSVPRGPLVVWCLRQSFSCTTNSSVSSALGSILTVLGRVRCPWHGACFSTKTGDIEDFPGWKGKLACYPVSVEGEDVMIHATPEMLGKQLVDRDMVKCSEADHRLIVIVGGGAAGATAAESLRAEGWTGRVLVLAAEQHLPYDRTKLSKAMKLNAKQIQLRPQEFWDEWNVEVSLNSEVTELDAEAKKVTYKVGSEIKFVQYEAALVATGATPNRLAFIPGHDAKGVMVLRNPEEAYAIHKAAKGKNVVVVGSSFIGMEVAACIARRATSVTVVGMEKVPFERVLGEEVGAFMKKLHEANGIAFKLESMTKEFKVDEDGKVTSVNLADGTILPADIVIIGAGVVPALGFIKNTETLKTNDRCLHVDEFLNTSVPSLFAAGDVAAFPLHLTESEQRVEHWAHAQNQGSLAAKNIVAFLNGTEKQPFRNIPVFWTAQYGKSIRYAGRADKVDSVVLSIQEETDIKNSKLLAFFMQDGTAKAVASLNRDPIVMEIAEKWNAGVSISEEDARKYL